MPINIYFQKRSLNYFENYIKYLINGRLKRPFYSNKIWRPGISQRGRRPKGRKRGKASAWSTRTDPWGSPSDPALILTFLTPFLRPATQAIQEYIKISDLVSAQFLLFPNIQEVSAVADQHTHLLCISFSPLNVCVSGYLRKNVIAWRSDLSMERISEWITSCLRHVAMLVCYLFTTKPFYDVYFPFGVKLV